MATDLAHSYAALVKADKNDDGTMTVYGKATDDSIDIDQQICDDAWLKRAMPDWMMAGGNVREQHSNIAAGVATDYEVKGDGHYITALVVDPVSVKKVETGVLKGFSIGIRSPRVIRDEKAAGGRIIDGQIVEVSLVDRPANPNAKLMLAKAAESGELMAVKQGVPTPADVFGKSDTIVVEPVEAEVVEDAPVVEAPVVEDAPAVSVVADVPAEGVTIGEAPAEVAPVEEVAPPAREEVAVLHAPKDAEPDLVKFDESLYNAAIEAVAALIKAETDEIVTEGDDERKDIKCLLKAMKHLQKFHAIEAEKGEAPMLPSDAEHLDEDEVEQPEMLELAADAEEADDKMCEKCNKSVDDCECDAEKSVSFDDAQIESVIEKAVASAKASVTEELESLKTALKAVEAEKVQLTDELETAKKAAVAGGPKRSANKSPESHKSELLQKAAEFRLKASATTDRILAEGYREMADDLEAKASRKDV